MSEYLVVGESVADIVRTPGRPDVVHPGGSPANVAYGLARLGHRVALLTELGADATGGLIGGHLRSAGVEVLAQPVARTPSAVVTLDADGVPGYQLDIHWTLRASGDCDRTPAHLHFGSVAALLAPGAAATLALAERLRGSATVSYDPNIRPALLGDRPDAAALVERCCAAADVVKASEEDVAWLYPGRGLDEVAAHWLAAGPALVLLTRGAAGAVGYARGGASARVAAVPAVVVDTVGAGDSFTAATLDALAARDLLGPAARPALAALTPAVLAEVLGHAARAAAVTVSRAGAKGPDRAELTAG